MNPATVFAGIVTLGVMAAAVPCQGAMTSLSSSLEITDVTLTPLSPGTLRMWDRSGTAITALPAVQIGAQLGPYDPVYATEGQPTGDPLPHVERDESLQGIWWQLDAPTADLAGKPIGMQWSYNLSFNFALNEGPDFLSYFILGDTRFLPAAMFEDLGELATVVAMRNPGGDEVLQDISGSYLCSWLPHEGSSTFVYGQAYSLYYDARLDTYLDTTPIAVTAVVPEPAEGGLIAAAFCALLVGASHLRRGIPRDRPQG